MKRKFKLPVVFADYNARLVSRPPKDDEGRECNGLCHEAERRIVAYDAPFNEELTRATLWHEWLHATFTEMGRPGLSKDEALVDGLANALMRVRLEQPWM